MTDISHDLLFRIQPHVYSWTKKYGTTFLFWFGPKAQLIVLELEIIREILNNKDKNYPKIDFQGYVNKILGDGLVTSVGEKWSKIRKLANFAFHGESLKNMIPSIIASVEMMLASWEKHCGNEIDVDEEFMFLTSEVISKAPFGSSYLKGKDMFDILGKLRMLIVDAFKIRLPVGF